MKQKQRHMFLSFFSFQRTTFSVCTTGNSWSFIVIEGGISLNYRYWIKGIFIQCAKTKSFLMNNEDDNRREKLPWSRIFSQKLINDRSSCGGGGQVDFFPRCSQIRAFALTQWALQGASNIPPTPESQYINQLCSPILHGVPAQETEDPC